MPSSSDNNQVNNEMLDNKNAFTFGYIDCDVITLCSAPFLVRELTPVWLAAMQ